MKEPKWPSNGLLCSVHEYKVWCGFVGSDGGDAAAEECKELEVPNLDIGVHHGISGTGVPNKFTLIRPKNAE